jgi:hypothetical protein
MDCQNRGTELRRLPNFGTYQGQQGMSSSSECHRCSTFCFGQQVIGNFHFSPGRAYQTNQVSFQDLVPYLKDKNHHDFGHVINKLQFEGEATSNGMSGKAADDLTKSMKKRLGIVNPLDGAVVHPEECKCAQMLCNPILIPCFPFLADYMYQCASSVTFCDSDTKISVFPLDFLKVVSTTYNLLSGETVNSHQYSVTQFERDLTQGNAPGKEGHGREYRCEIFG